MKKNVIRLLFSFPWAAGLIISFSGEDNKGWQMLTRMGWKTGKGLGFYEDGASTPPLSLEDTNGSHGFGLRHVSDRCTLDPRPVKFMESWEIGQNRTSRL
jgi:hypothetical protein